MALFWKLGIFFTLLQTFLIFPSGANPDSRLATLAAMKDNATFEIDRPEWSMDLSVTSDGKFYSNKAPGPIFFGYPIFYLMDSLLFLTQEVKDPEAVFKKRKESKDFYFVPLNLILQILPFFFLVFFIVQKLYAAGYNKESLLFLFLSTLFANTVTIFTNSFFGHAISAIFILVLVFSILNKHYFWAGLSFGFALLSDYGAAFLIPALAFLSLKEIRNFKSLGFIILGGFLPGLLWIYYHTVTFGGPFEIALKYQDASMHILKDESSQIWGIFSYLPNWVVIGELLWGTKRGILVTQPWIFVLSYFLFKYRKQSPETNSMAIFLLPSAFLLLLMNASFGGWWAGGSSGPRYISIIFPAFGLAIPFLWSHLTGLERGLLKYTIVFALVFNLLVFLTQNQAPPSNLWSWITHYLFDHPKRSLARLAGIFLFSAIAHFAPVPKAILSKKFT